MVHQYIPALYLKAIHLFIVTISSLATVATFETPLGDLGMFSTEGSLWRCFRSACFKELTAMNYSLSLECAASLLEAAGYQCSWLRLHIMLRAIECHGQNRFLFVVRRGRTWSVPSVRIVLITWNNFKAEPIRNCLLIHSPTSELNWHALFKAFRFWPHSKKEIKRQAFFLIRVGKYARSFKRCLFCS